MKHVCPVCSFPDLQEPPHSKGGGGSFEICPSCGFQFGVSDVDRGFSYLQWREIWIKGGAKWSSQQPPPTGWNGLKQVAKARGKAPGK